MNNLLKVLLLIIVFAEARADRTLASDFCEKFQSTFSGVNSDLTFSLKELSRLQTDEVQTEFDLNDGITRRKKDDFIRNGRNIIFLQGSLTPPSKSDVMKEWKAAVELIKPFRPHINSLKNIESLEACENYVSEVKLDIATFNRNFEEFNHIYSELKLKLEFITIEKEIRQLMRGLRQSWEIWRVTNLEDVKEQIRDKNIRNVVIVSHANRAGKLIDSEGIPFPQRFFRGLAENLFSLGIYSCYSQKILEFYELEGILKRNSVYKNRLLFSVAEVPELAAEQLAPMSRISNFIKSVDRKIVKEIKKNISRIENEEMAPLCKIRVKNILTSTLSDTSKEKLNLILKDFFIGQLGSKKNEFSFPCSKLSFGENQLWIQPASDKLPEIDEVDLEIFGLEERNIMLSSKVFKRSGNWRSQKITISVE